ncbi:Rrf2 family transcriptional regulator [Bacillus altitudinis MN12]|uniref:Rrf2 family transcriptional regulator n=1 Tax=Bacillus altitudinis TaxID=293387 RepID=A0ABV1S708_BACAB|nr:MULTISPECIES: Rrf2 family transcriptional regulator [Bacillus]KMK98669.1 Rrf2 family transcriptional regulator [Bacillus stratosphericus]KQL39579.1 Rrf2 family transcriptional regulator [Bacillus sp. FJAT-21955]MBR0581538.1 Rrf2 family transcriptional regulator [Bacillus altitudinis MN12]MBR0595292.1 Rrf2 family transcriptional regulator [Bacillus altitudinis C16B11]MBW3699282.1 Rrf2 family transcriptional regulator [Bacillus aerophilus]BAT48818.1 transcriptional regulator [Bacillus pumilu
MKQISSRYTIAVHILSFIAGVSKECTGDFIAESVNSNPVIIRKMMAMLKKADLIEIRRGVGGASLKRPAEDITLLDVYRAVDVSEDEELFNFHQPVIACPIGQAMDTRLRQELKEAQSALEHHLKQVTIKQLLIEAE